MLESVVRHGPDDGTAPHPGALRIELLHPGGQPAAISGRERNPVAYIEQDLRILGADRVGAIRMDRHSGAIVEKAVPRRASLSMRLGALGKAIKLRLDETMQIVNIYINDVVGIWFLKSSAAVAAREGVESKR